MCRTDKLLKMAQDAWLDHAQDESMALVIGLLSLLVLIPVWFIFWKHASPSFFGGLRSYLPKKIPFLGLIFELRSEIQTQHHEQVINKRMTILERKITELQPKSLIENRDSKGLADPNFDDLAHLFELNNQHNLTQLKRLFNTTNRHANAN